MKTEKSLALCIIAGNVEHLIERFVKSFQQLTPHIYVVRACGSQTPDQTLEIAKSLGCKVGIYENAPEHCEWDHVDHFGKARQQAFDMGQADGHDFLMWADTDDVIDLESAKRLSEVIQTNNFDMLYCAYRLSNNGLAPFRERIGKAGMVRWDGAVHEHLEPITPETKLVRLQDDFSYITHLPGTQRKDKPNERNVRIIESLPSEPRYQFYVCQEYHALGRFDDAVKTATEALTAWQKDKSLLQSCEAYELFILLASWNENPEGKFAFLREAWAIEPWRREALCFLSAVYADAGKRQESLAVARMAMSLPRPQETPWTHREALYRWAGIYVYTYALRLNDKIAEADDLEAKIFSQAKGKITIIHPTRGRPEQASMYRKLWLERAYAPENVEYIFGISEDDHESREALKGFRSILIPAGTEKNDYVRKCNELYRVAKGEVIVCAADDVEPPQYWDAEIIKSIPDITKPYVVKVGDGFRNDDLMVTMIFTKSAPSMLGLPKGEFLSSEYIGVYSDNEFSVRSHKAGIVIQTPLVFLHHHPYFEKIEWDETYETQNNPEQMEKGKETFARRNPDFV